MAISLSASSTKLRLVVRYRWRVFLGFLRRCKRGVVLVLLLWILHYARSVRRVCLHLGKGRGTRLERIVRRCPSLVSVYWPTWFAHTPIFQLLLLSAKEIRARLLQRSPYERETLALSDGSCIALDWVTPSEVTPGAKGAPVCVLLHGACQDSRSVTMIDLARSLAGLGMPTVVMNRRGYGGLELAAGQAARVAIFGLDEDLDEVLDAVGRREPGRDVAIIGFSCGSGYAGRYVGTRSYLTAWNKSSENIQRRGACSIVPRLLCGVAYDPGYDVSPDGAVARIRPPWSWGMNLCLKYQYGFLHRAPLRGRSPSACDLVGQVLSPKSGLRDTYRRVLKLTGAGDSSACLRIQQPKVGDISMPTLLINSRDDPICDWSNVEAFAEEIASNPNLVLAELQRGAHGCKFDFWGYSSVAHGMIGEFVLASWRELSEWRSKGGS